VPDVVSLYFERGGCVLRNKLRSDASKCSFNSDDSSDRGDRPFQALAKTEACPIIDRIVLGNENQGNCVDKSIRGLGKRKRPIR
jgi:hypothetical protein